MFVSILFWLIGLLCVFELAVVWVKLLFLVVFWFACILFVTFALSWLLVFSLCLICRCLCFLFWFIFRLSVFWWFSFVGFDVMCFVFFVAFKLWWFVFYGFACVCRVAGIYGCFNTFVYLICLFWTLMVWCARFGLLLGWGSFGFWLCCYLCCLLFVVSFSLY